MSRRENVEEVLGKARALEKKYEWVKAAENYEQTLSMVGKKDFLTKGKYQERIGYCFYRAAMQAESQEEFKEGMRRAIEACEKARGFYEKLMDDEKAAIVLRCEAVAKFLGYWLTPDPSEKRNLLDECLEAESKALGVFLESGDMLEYGRTYNELMLVFLLRRVLEWDRQTIKRIVERGLEWGEKAVAVLSELGYSHETAGACLAFADCLDSFRYCFIAELEEQEKNRLRVIEYLNKAVVLSEKVGDAFLLGLSHLWLGANTGGEEPVRHYKKTLECGTRTGDNFLIAGGLDFLAYATYWEAIAKEDFERYKELAEKAMQFYERAQHHYSIILFTSPRGGFIGSPAGHAEHYYTLATRETDPNKRLEYLEKSEKAGMKALKLAEDCDMPIVVGSTLHAVSKTLQLRAHVESDPMEKKTSLEEGFGIPRKNNQNP